MDHLPPCPLLLDRRPSGTTTEPGPRLTAPPPRTPATSTGARPPIPASGHHLGQRAGALLGLAWGDAPVPGHPASRITRPGAEWLASAAETSSRTVGSGWRSPSGTCGSLPCGTVFDVVSVPTLLGRGLLEHLWSDGPGSGPVAAHRGRLLLFAAVGTARRLPALLGWERWNRSADLRGEPLPPLLCHGLGDAVTVPPPHRPEGATGGCRWLVAPEVRHPWLPGPEVLLWACVRATRGRPHPVDDPPRP